MYGHASSSELPRLGFGPSTGMVAVEEAMRCSSLGNLLASVVAASRPRLHAPVGFCPVQHLQKLQGGGTGFLDRDRFHMQANTAWRCFPLHQSESQQTPHYWWILLLQTGANQVVSLYSLRLRETSAKLTRHWLRPLATGLVACAARHRAPALALHDLTLQRFLLLLRVVRPTAGRNVAPAVATAKAGIAACLASCSTWRTWRPSCARRSMRLAAGDCTGILVDAIIASKPGAVAAVSGALSRSPIGRVCQASQPGSCSSQGCKRDCEAQACEHRAATDPE